MKKPQFAPSRFVFKGPQSGQSSDVESQALPEAEKPLSREELDELKKKAAEALSAAKAEKDNIERQYGKPDRNGELPDSTPPDIREQYEKLNETIKGLRASGEKAERIIRDSLRDLENITTSLDTIAEKSRENVASRDSMAPLYAFERRPKPAPKAEEAQSSAKAKSPAKPTPAPKETIDQAEQRILNDFCNRFEGGSNEVTPAEAAYFKKAIAVNGYILHDVPATKDRPGHSYEIEISKDKKWIRVTSRLEAEQGQTKDKYTGVLALEKDAEGQPEFALKTDEEAMAADIEKNKADARSKLEWLASDEAPLGSVLLLFTKIVERKNHDSGEKERFMQSYTVKKGADGLRFATLEFPIDKDDNALGPVKEVRSEKTYTIENALAMVADKETIRSEGTEKDRKAEIRKGLNDLGHTLIAQLPFGGETSPNFQNTLREIKAMLTRFNVTKWSYRDTIMGKLTRYADGKLTIYDADTKNPEYVSPEKTPDIPKYMAELGPIDMSKYA